jgi:hypothetical protein
MTIHGREACATLRRSGEQSVVTEDGAMVSLEAKATFTLENDKSVIISEYTAFTSAENPNYCQATAVIDIVLPLKLPESLAQQAIGKPMREIVDMTVINQLYGDNAISEIHQRDLAGCDDEMRITLKDDSCRISILKAYRSLKD